MQFATRVFLFLLSIVLGTANAQHYSFQSFTVEQGLSQSQNKKVFLDSRGYLWFGSFEGGLSKYDGSSFTSYTEKHGLVNNKVRTIAEDKEGKLWIGTEEGVSVFDGKRFKTIPPPENESFSILSLAPDIYGNVWIGTQRNGLFCHSSSGQTFKISLGSLYEQATVRSVQTDLNTIYISTDVGFLQGKISGPSEVKLEFEGLNHTGNSCFLKIDDENYLLGSFEGLFIYSKGDISTFDKHPLLSSSDIKDLFKDSKGNIWIATYGKGAFLIENFGQKNQIIKPFNRKEGILHNRILSISEDLNGHIWFCTYGGVSKFLGQAFMHLSTEDGLSNNLVWDVKADSHNIIWIAHNGGLSRYDGTSLINLSTEDGFDARKSSAIVFDNNRRMYIATNNGLYIYNKGKFIKPSFPDNPDYLDLTLLYIDKTNKLWIGGEQKIYTLDLNDPFETHPDYHPGIKKTAPVYQVRFFAESHALGHSVINSIWQDSYGLYWFATDGGGITTFDGNSFRRITKKDGLPSNTINYIEEDAEGNIWMATSLAGIIKLSFNDRKSFQYKLEFITEDEGLSSNNIYSLLVSGSELWAGTEKGINKIILPAVQNSKKKTKETSPVLTYDIEHYGANEGFQAIEANHKAVTLDNEGNIWWGTIRGVTKYSPQYDYPEGRKINCQITGINLFFEEVDWMEKYAEIIPWIGLPVQLNLSYKQNHLTFKYNGINYRNSQKVQYRYMLEGFDQSFSPAQRKTEAVYSNIPPGTYTFKVIADAGKGLWTQQPLSSYSFTIEKPYWMTWWFLSLCLLFIFGGVYVVIAGRTYHLKMQKLVLTRKVKERTFQIERQKQQIESQLDEIEAQRDQLAFKSETLEQAFSEIERKNNQITSSITYARRIQQAILPLEESIKNAFPESFILFKPRDIVSGDFYWFSNKGRKKYIAAVDCTGHGVPGAFMSMIGYSLLNQIIIENDIQKPSQILSLLHKGVKEALKQENEGLRNSDGMDIALCSIDMEQRIAEFSGAKRPLYLIRNNEISEIKGTKYSIGGVGEGLNESERQFENHVIELQQGDQLYLTSDGFADQFGGPEDKKLMVKSFKSILTNISVLTCGEQKKALKNILENWKGNTHQTDDILVIGLKI